MILFLDFDGVLHPNAGPEPLFVEVPRLAAWLEAWPQVDVVISSSWRMAHSQRWLVEMLGPVIGARIVGCTSWDRQERDDNVYPTARMTVLTHERQRQVEAWVASSWDPDRAWVALDDMPYLFEVDCRRLVVCAGRQGISGESIKALDRHAERVGLRCSPGTESGSTTATGHEGKEASQAEPFTFERYVKHTAPCLPDGLFRITVDPGRLLVTITAAAFDSELVACLVTQILPDEHGIVAYRDDDAGWVHTPVPYELRIRFGGPTSIELGAQVVRLSAALGGTVAVRLSEPQQLTVGVN